MIDVSSLKTVVDSLPHAAAVLSPDGAFIHENFDFRSLRIQAVPKLSRNGFFATFNAQERMRIKRMLHGDDSDGVRCIQVEWQLPGDATSRHLGEFTALTSEGEIVAILCQLIVDQSTNGPKLRYLMENLEQGVWDHNLQTGVFVASRSWHALRGFDPDHLVNLESEDWLQNIHPDDRDTLKDALYRQSAGQSKSLTVQYRHIHTDGHWVWILCRGSVVESTDDGRPLRIVGTDTDISEAMESQQAMERMASKLTLAVEASGMGIWEFNPITKSVHWDDRMLEIYGITDGRNERSGNLWEVHLHPDDYDDTVAYAVECSRLNRDFIKDYRIIRPDGKVRHIRSMARAVGAADATRKLIGVNIDVTDDYARAQELEAARAQLEHEVLHDNLTGLGNRRALDQAAGDLFNRLEDTRRYAVMQIDLDHFKEVNDTLGHPAGDFVLSRVGRMLKQVLQDHGNPYRVGGDEFTILFEEAPDKSTLNAICERLLDAVSVPMEFEGQPCCVGVSIGYAIGKGPPKSQSSIFIEADTALYAAKRAGRFTYRAYTEDIGKEFHLVSNTRQDLRDALGSDQIVCFFQPQYDAETLDVVGAEALVRWQCPKRGLLAPGQFLPNAVDAGLLEAIDEYVFLRVARLQTQWAQQGMTYPKIAVNVSRARLEDEEFLAQTRATLSDHHHFAFELLETTFYDNPDTALLFKLDSLREMGISIEMDDFGTGHSSVKALQALRPDTVKIDRSLVAPLGKRDQQLNVLQNLSSIARLEGAKIVVEGLETGTHMAAIRKLDCDILQGYALQRPMAELEFAALLNKGEQAFPTVRRIM